ncbi:MAG: GNAT family N-acetyltransferase [Candidatus Thorarchaeota archaeon]
MYSGAHIYLRALEMEDLDSLMKFINNVETRQYLGSLLPNSRLSEEKWLEGASTADPWKDGKIVFAIVEKTSQELLGTASLFSISKAHGHAEFGISIWNPEGRDKGYGTDAALVTLWVGFHVLGLNNIYLYALEHNTRAIRTYEKAGFKKIGVFREHMYSMGKFQNAIAMDILKDEFMKKYPPGTMISDQKKE